MKRTNIVATIGMASADPEMLKKMSKAGVNVYRLNFSHGTHEEHKQKIEIIRNLGLRGAILLDTKGPEIRTGEVKDKLELKTGDKFTITTEKGIYEDTGKVSVSYKEFINDVDVEDIIVIDSGAMLAKALKKSGNDIEFEVIEGNGKITTKRHINLQGKHVSLPTITENDWKDIDFGIKNKVDFIALSFVREAKDVIEVKEYCIKNGLPDVKIISKIESAEAIENLEEIVQESDGLMVARGDLACEISFATIPHLQKKMSELCLAYKKPIIIATQMLMSMVENISPTRAEISDVANAVFDFADAVMLSDESTKSKDPSHVVKIMTRIVEETEIAMDEDNRYSIPSDSLNLLGEYADSADVIISIENGDYLANEISNTRMNMPLYAFTNNQANCNQMALLWNTDPYKIDLTNDFEKNVKFAEKKVKEILPEAESYILVAEKNINGKIIPVIEFREFC